MGVLRAFDPCGDSILYMCTVWCRILAMRRKIGVRKGKPERAVARAQALVRKHIPAGKSLADELIEERRREAKREEG